MPLSGQNLIVNGGFEDTLSCPDMPGQLYKSNGWSKGFGTPDLFHKCTSNPLIGVPISFVGYNETKTGSAMSHIGIFIGSNILANYEYLKTQLKEGLVKNHVYCFKMWLKLADTSKYAFDQLGVALFENNYWQEQGIIYFTPQMVTERGLVLNNTTWTLIELSFIATGGERFMIIGQFNERKDVTIDTVNPSSFINEANYLFDDISLIDCTPIITITIPNIFTPNGNGQNDNFTATIENAESVNIFIYNRWGGEVFTSQDPNFSWDGTFDGNPVADGVYFVVIQATSLTGENVIEKQTLHLMR